MRKCERCGSADVSWTSDTATLCGGLVVTLCNPCSRAWGDLLTAHPLWRRVAGLEAREDHYRSLALANSPVGEAQWRELHEAFLDVRREIFELSKEFLASAPVAEPAAKA